MGGGLAVAAAVVPAAVPLPVDRAENLATGLERLEYAFGRRRGGATLGEVVRGERTL